MRVTIMGAGVTRDTVEAIRGASWEGLQELYLRENVKGWEGESGLVPLQTS